MHANIFAAAAARQRAAQAVAAAADRRGGSCGSSGLCRGRVHGGGTCGVWQRRRQRGVWRQHWHQRRRLLMPHAGYGAWARRYSGDSPTAPACGGGVCGCVSMACVCGRLGGDRGVCDDLTCGSCAARRVVVGFNPENLNQLVVQGRGDGGLDEVTAVLDPAQVRDYCLVTAHIGGCLWA